MTTLRPHPSVRPPSSVYRAHAGAAPASAPRSQTTVRALRWLPLAAVLLTGAASPAASRAHDAGPGAAADTLRVSLAPPEGGEVAEGAQGSFRVSVAGSTAGGAVTVRYTVSGTAVAGSDYKALSGEVTVAQGDSTAGILLSALADDILDDGETVVLRLASATGALPAVADTATAAATITDDGEVTVEITPAADSVPEGGTWATTVTLSMAVAEPVSVRWRTSDGTAVSDRDYGGMSAEVVFAPGERSKPIAVKTMKDGVSELAEMFYVALDGAAARAAGASGRGGRVRFDTARRSGYIECNVEYPDGPWTIHTLGVPKGTDVGTPVVPAAEGDPAYTYSLAGGAGKFEVDSATGQISTTEDIEWRPGLSYSLTVTAEHTCGASGSIEVQIILKTPPEPVDSIPDFRIDVNVTDSVDVSGKFRDRDGDFLRYNASSSAPSTVSVTMNGNWVVFTLDGQGDATVTVTATDPWNYSAIQAFLVEYRNDPPVCDETPLTLEPGESVDLSPPCTDADDHTITYSGTRSDDTGVATAQLRGTTLTISGVAAGRTTVRVTADDGHGGVVNAAIPVTVNTVPVCDETPLTLEPGESVDLSGIPAPTGTGTRSPTRAGARTTRGTATAQLRGTTLTISGVAAGRTTVRVTANDGHGGVVNAAIPVTVNTVPVCDETPLTLEPGESVDLADPCTDGDGHTLTYSGGGSDDTGAATAQLRGTTLTISGVAAGRTTVRVTANDGHGGVVNAAIPVTVNTVPGLRRDSVDSGARRKRRPVPSLHRRGRAHAHLLGRGLGRHGGGDRAAQGNDADDQRGGGRPDHGARHRQ